jgi:uncharacterized protein YegP (UPF0339 family)
MICGRVAGYRAIWGAGLNLYGWRLLSGAGQVLATSRSYPTKAAAIEAAKAVIRASTNAVLVDRTAS